MVSSSRAPPGPTRNTVLAAVQLAGQGKATQGKARQGKARQGGLVRCRVGRLATPPRTVLLLLLLACLIALPVCFAVSLAFAILSPPRHGRTPCPNPPQIARAVSEQTSS